jgi:hypothetical protein
LGGYQLFGELFEQREFITPVQRDMALYMCYEVVKCPNPFEPIVKLYELGTRPRGIMWIADENVFIPKFVVDIPLAGKNITSSAGLVA